MWLLQRAPCSNVCLLISTCRSSSLLLIFPLVVTVRHEREWYSVEEEDGRVTLVLVLDRAVPFNVTVIVNTLDLQDSSVGDAASGELLEFGLWRNVCVFFCDNLQLPT